MVHDLRNYKALQDYFVKLNIPVVDADFQQSKLQQLGLFEVATSCLRALQYYLIPFCEKEYINLFYTNNVHRKNFMARGVIILMLHNKFTEYSRVVPPY